MNIKAIAGVALVAFSVTASTHAAQAYSNHAGSAEPMAELTNLLDAYSDAGCGDTASMTGACAEISAQIDAVAAAAEHQLTKRDWVAPKADRMMDRVMKLSQLRDSQESRLLQEMTDDSPSLSKIAGIEKRINEYDQKIHRLKNQVSRLLKLL